ncbi:MAG: hypothetical protein JNK82_10355 [Myxococcaceae bacterium]|nr:hypothetical protein [Myxococcaceae bacterium]
MRALLVTALTLVACGGPLEEEADVAPSATATGSAIGMALQVRVGTSAGESGLRNRFAIDQTDAVYFTATGAQGAGTHTVAFEVYDPSGSMWQRSESTLTGGRATASMPVAGTWVQQYALTGKWQVLVFVDDAPDAAGQLSFALR